MIEFVTDSLLESNEQYIVHQCNCVATEAGGIAYAIFVKHPYANDYARRFFTHKADQVGTIKVHGDGRLKRHVINAFSQLLPGGAGLSENDTAEKREKYFKDCLEEILQIPDLKSIAFPYNIGCKIAGGNWDNYYKMIEEFSKRTPATVKIYRRLED